MNDDEKACPSCAETIKAKAVRCRFCGHEMEVGQRPAAVQPPPVVHVGPTKNSFQSCMGCVGVVIAIILVMAAAGSGSSDDETPEVLAPPRAISQDVVGAPTPSPTSSPAFAMNEVEARDLVESFGSKWRGMTAWDPSEDGYTGGFRRMFTARDRSAMIFTLPDGRVWNLQLNSGMGGRCGSAKTLIPLIEPTLKALAPGVTLTKAQYDQVVKGLRSRGSAEIVEVGDVRVGGSGLCVLRLDVRKPQRRTD